MSPAGAARVLGMQPSSRHWAVQMLLVGIETAGPKSARAWRVRNERKISIDNHSSRVT